MAQVKRWLGWAGVLLLTSPGLSLNDPCSPEGNPDNSSAARREPEPQRQETVKRALSQTLSSLSKCRDIEMSRWAAFLKAHWVEEGSPQGVVLDHSDLSGALGWYASYHGYRGALKRNEVESMIGALCELGLLQGDPMSAVAEYFSGVPGVWIF